MDSDAKLEEDLMRSFGKELVKTQDFKDRLKLQWYNRAAALLANRLAEMIHRPDQIVTEKKGKVIWKDIDPMFNLVCTNKYTCLSVYDKLNRIHFTPVVHMDYCSMSMIIDLNDEVSDNIAKISDSLKYNKSTKELSAEGDFPTAAVVQFAIVKRINNGKLGLGDARDVYKIWIQLVYEEWLDIIQGKEITKAVLSAVLERYILDDPNIEPECIDENAHPDSLTKIINDVISTKALKASDIRALKTGQKIKVILFDRNIGDYNDGKNRGEKVSTKKYLSENHLAIYTHEFDLTGKLYMPHINETFEEWTWEINTERWTGVYWGPIDMVKEFYEEDVPDDTRVGWRGPAILEKDIKHMPKYFIHYDTCSDDYAPARDSK